MRAAVVIPVKSFTVAKGRLAGALTPSARADLARRCAENVVGAAHPLPVFVVCDDDHIEAWAESHGARTVRCATPGLDAAVAAGRAAAHAAGFDHVIVAHADLPLASHLDHVAVEGAVSLVPDRHRDGTNVLAFPVDSPFTTAYGPGSFQNHVLIARRVGMETVVIDDPSLALDLDTVDDLDELERRTDSRDCSPQKETPT